MQPIGKKYFNPNKKIAYPKHSIEIWPGYVTAVNLINEKVFVNVDLSFKVVRKVNALQHFKELMQGGDKDRARDQMIGSTVMTQYNNRMYMIDDVDFSKKVSDSFDAKEGE